MGRMLPERQLYIATLGSAKEYWSAFRERLMNGADSNDGLDPDAWSDVQMWASAQRHRRNYLAGMPKSLAADDLLTLRLAIRDVGRYRDTIAAELDALRVRRLPSVICDLFEEEIRYSEDYILYVEEALQVKGGGKRSAVDEIIEPITSKIQLKIALKSKFDALKQQTPTELHADLEQAFRQAMEQLDRR
jgi:hypothetical protein